MGMSEEKPLEDWTLATPDQIFNDFLRLVTMTAEGRHPADISALLPLEGPERT